MRHLIVGDIHGKVEIVEKALAQEYPVIFLGDFLDSFDRPVLDHVKCMELVFDAIDSGKAQSLYGNHELSYLMSSQQCSGYNKATAAHITGGWKNDMAGRFVSFLFYAPNILITHAGLDKRIWDKFNLNLEVLPRTLAEWTADTESPAYWIGKVRGGWDSVGGIFWCDFNREFIEIPELVQIVGHTAGKDLRQIGNSYCIDYFNHKQDFFYWDLPD